MIKVKQFELGSGSDGEIQKFLEENHTYKELTITSVGGDNNGMIIVIVRM